MSRRRVEYVLSASLLAVLVLAGPGILLGGCASAPTANPYATGSAVERDPQRAREIYAEAKRAFDQGSEETEGLLRAALAADLYLGPAHNNLGVLLLERGELYEAASEFEWARKLMPGHPAPRVNLAMTLERAGKTEDALAAYDAALAVYEGYLPAVQGKARLQIAGGRADDQTADLLSEIALRADQRWRDWARLWRTKLANRGIR